MKKIQAPILICLAGLMVSLVGCSKNESVTQIGSMTDEQALQSQVIGIDSVAAFSESDEATIDDAGLRADEYESASTVMSDDVASFRKINADSLYPVHWGRRITNVVRHYNVIIYGDTLANVMITKTITGEFRIGFGSRTPDTTIVDTVVKKPFALNVDRTVVFKRIAHTDNPLRNWIPIAVTMVQGKTQGASTFSILSLEVSDTRLHYDATVTDPLSTFFRLGVFHGSVPIFPVRDSIKVRVTITSSDTSSEIVHVRHGIAGNRNHPEFRRLRMQPISVSGSAGNYTRVYERTFVTHLPPWINFVGRFNLVVDVLSRGSIFDTAAPYSNEFWGAPYIIVR